MDTAPLRYLSTTDVLAAMPSIEERLELAATTMRALVDDADLPPKIGVHPAPDGSFAHAMPAWMRGVPDDGSGDLLGIKWVVGFPKSQELGLPAIHGTAILSDASTGSPRAIMDAGGITALRTAAVSGAAISRWGPAGMRDAAGRAAGRAATRANDSSEASGEPRVGRVSQAGGAPEVVPGVDAVPRVATAAGGAPRVATEVGTAPRVAIIGAGVQARSHLPIVDHLMPGSTVVVCDRDPARLASIADEIESGAYGSAFAGVETTTDATAAIEGAALVLTLVSFGPDRQSVPPEAFAANATVVAVDYDMCVPAAVATGAALFLTDDREQFLANRTDVQFVGYPEPTAMIGEAINAATPRPDGRVLISHLGVGLADVVFGDAILRRAESRGIGTVLER